MSDDAARLTVRQAFEATRYFLQAYWERGGRGSEDVAMLLSDLDADPAQWNDWLAAVSRVERQSG
jgi:hypothetical protein